MMKQEGDLSTKKIKSRSTFFRRSLESEGSVKPGLKQLCLIYLCIGLFLRESAH